MKPEAIYQTRIVTEVRLTRFLTTRLQNPSMAGLRAATPTLCSVGKVVAWYEPASPLPGRKNSHCTDH